MNGTQRYHYDAQGRRVKRLVGQTGANGEVWQVYDPDGLLLAEYPKQGAAAAPVKEYGYRGGQLLVVFDSTEAGDKQLQWLLTDHLGSTRMVIDRSGSLSGIKRRDYLPFGEELAATVGHRAASGSGYPAGNNPKQKFTGYERDDETGLDYAQARYYANAQGRFTSIDPENAGAALYEPQSWNAYTYGLNNPLIYTDPTGEIWTKDDQGRPVWVPNADYEKDPSKYTVWENLEFDSNGHKVVLDSRGPSGDYAGWSYDGQMMGIDGNPLPANQAQPDLGFVGPTLLPQPVTIPTTVPQTPSPPVVPSIGARIVLAPLAVIGLLLMLTTPVNPDEPQVHRWRQQQHEVQDAKGGKQRQKDTGLEGLPDEELKKLARDRSLPPAERRRYQKEEKARKSRNIRKRGGK